MKIENAQISWLETGLPFSEQFQDIYYSKDDAQAESQQVFLQANKLRARLREASDLKNFHIGELGFGSGLNFLQVMQLWDNLEERPKRLHYLAFELHPLTSEQMNKLHAHWAELFPQSKRLLDQYCDHSEGCHRYLFSNGVTLDLYFGDAQTQMAQRLTQSCPAVQCWFLDGFTPSSNSALWAKPLMQLIANSSEQQTTLSSYSVAGSVRNALSEVGFNVRKVDGFGSKRHNLVAKMSTLAEHRKTDSTPRSEPWLELPGAQAQGSDVLIIGAGLAGSSTAYSLAQRGWNVTVIDAGTKDSGAASKNAYMALRCRLFNSSSAEASFFLHGYHFALRQFSELKRHSNINWNPCGVVQLDLAMNKKKPLQAEKIRELYSDSIVKLIDRNTASAEAGLELSDQAWHFPAGGSMDPASLCAAYLDHPRIRTLQDTSVDRLSKRGERWFASVNDRDIATGDVVVIANSFGATEFEQASFLPLQRLRGQTTNVEQSEKSATLKCIVSGLRSVYPASGGQHLISASYHISSELGSRSKIRRKI